MWRYLEGLEHSRSAAALHTYRVLAWTARGRLRTATCRRGRTDDRHHSANHWASRLGVFFCFWRVERKGKKIKGKSDWSLLDENLAGFKQSTSRCWRRGVPEIVENFINPDIWEIKKKKNFFSSLTICYFVSICDVRANLFQIINLGTGWIELKSSPYLNSSGHIGKGGVLGSARRLGSLAGIVFSVDQVVASAEGNQMSIVRWGWDRHRTSAAHVCVAHLKFFLTFIFWDFRYTQKEKKPLEFYISLYRNSFYISSD